MIRPIRRLAYGCCPEVGLSPLTANSSANWSPVSRFHTVQTYGGAKVLGFFNWFPPLRNTTKPGLTCDSTRLLWLRLLTELPLVDGHHPDDDRALKHQSPGLTDVHHGEQALEHGEYQHAADGAGQPA